jgi:hypothetical protein
MYAALAATSMYNMSSGNKIGAKNATPPLEDPVALRPKLNVWNDQLKLLEDPHRSKLLTEIKTMDTMTVRLSQQSSHKKQGKKRGGKRRGNGGKVRGK